MWSNRVASKLNYFNLWYQWQVTNRSLQFIISNKANEFGKLNKTLTYNTYTENTNIVKINNYLLKVNKTLIIHIILIILQGIFNYKSDLQ